MKLGTRIFLVFLLISVICFYYPIDKSIKDLRRFFLESVEDPLVDQANILAVMIGRDMEKGHFNTDDLHTIFQKVYSRSLSAKIYDFRKTYVDTKLYITNASGKILFDSENKIHTGTDYSHWRDVLLTLHGGYGTRTTRTNPKDPSTSVLHVAAPILAEGKMAGVLTLVKPTTNINAFIEQEKPKILRLWLMFGGLAVVLAYIVSIWLTQPVKRLTRYANDVRAGKRTSLPRVGHSELKDMGIALENMRVALEGKKYVEEYIHTLTHELKSPLSAIRGAAELLEEEMPFEKRARFLANIRTESARIQDLVDRMLELSELEMKRTLQTVETVSLAALIRTVLESKEPILARKNIITELTVDEMATVRGDPFLLHQALSNIIQNSIDFSPTGGKIRLSTDINDSFIAFIIDDEGPGIPDHTKEKVFDRFFSLQRPDTGKKSTGLGLNLVKEVAELHGGRIELTNLSGKGLRATLHLKVQDR